MWKLADSCTIFAWMCTLCKKEFQKAGVIPWENVKATYSVEEKNQLLRKTQLLLVSWLPIINLETFDWWLTEIFSSSKLSKILDWEENGFVITYKQSEKLDLNFGVTQLLCTKQN